MQGGEEGKRGRWACLLRGWVDGEMAGLDWVGVGVLRVGLQGRGGRMELGV